MGGGGADVCPPLQVFLGEVNSGIGSTQVVVKELKASASVHEQMQFLEEAQPYRWVAPGAGGLEEVGKGPGQEGGPCWTGGPVVPGELGAAPPSQTLLVCPPLLPMCESGGLLAPTGPYSTATCSSAWPSVPR